MVIILFLTIEYLVSMFIKSVCHYFQTKIGVKWLKSENISLDLIHLIRIFLVGFSNTYWDLIILSYRKVKIGLKTFSRLIFKSLNYIGRQISVLKYWN